MNPLGKLGNKIRLLTPEEQKYVINNVQPEGIDISKLTESIKNFKQNELTLDFIHGLFDGDGGLSSYFVDSKSSIESSSPSKLSIGFSYTIVQDVHNISLLHEIKSYFNNKGGVYKINDNCSIYKSGSKPDLISVILPKMANIKSIDWVKDGAINLASSGLSLPLLKYNKIYYSCKILELLKSSSLKGGQGLNKENMDEIIMLSYYISQDSDNITLEKYVEKVKLKFLLYPLSFF
jgi:hypothetical protein